MSIKMSDLPENVQKRLRQQSQPAAPKPSKYHNVPTVVDGIRFASKKEAAYYRELCVRRAVYDIDFFLMQVPFHLPGGVKYVADFVTYKFRGVPMAIAYQIEVIDVKGVRTKEYRLKKRQVEALYGFKIKEI